MIQEMIFNKKDNQWFIDLPEYPGQKADLQIVMGADKLLDTLAKEEGKVILLITTQVDDIHNLNGLPAFSTHNWEWLVRGDHIPVADGKYYAVKGGMYYAWLCPVTLWVFGDYPKYIYYKIKPNEKIQAQEDGPDF